MEPEASLLFATPIRLMKKQLSSMSSGMWHGSLTPKYHFQEAILCKASHMPLCWLHYAGNTFLIWPPWTVAVVFLNQINNIYVYHNSSWRQWQIATSTFSTLKYTGNMIFGSYKRYLIYQNVLSHTPKDHNLTIWSQN